jgi:hypothetical protein
MDEASAAVGWARGLLAGLAGGQVYDSSPPQGTVGDYIVLQCQSYTESGTAADGTLGAGNMLLTVKAVTQSAGFVSAGALSQSAHALLQGQTGTSNGITVAKCVRDSRQRYVENKDGIRYNHLAAIYRLTVTYP